jgi:hypothetical protein
MRPDNVGLDHVPDLSGVRGDIFHAPPRLTIASATKRLVLAPSAAAVAHRNAKLAAMAHEFTLPTSAKRRHRQDRRPPTNANNFPPFVAFRFCPTQA